MKSLGCDIALNHGAAVELTDGSVTNHWYFSNVAGVADVSAHGSRLPPECYDKSKEPDRHVRELKRLAWIERWFDKVVLKESAPDFAAIEDYAIRAEQGAHYLGAVGGIARILLWFRGIPFRLHDPISLKLFVAHDGTADKELMRMEVARRWGGGWDRYVRGQSSDTAGDLADAEAMARLVELEARIRAGDLSTRELEHDQEVRVFNRTTKTNPSNLLDRGWIHNPDGAPTPHGRFPACSSERCLLGEMDRGDLLSPKLRGQLIRR